MSVEARQAIGQLLARQLDYIAPDLQLLEYPFRCATAYREQRDEWARRCSLALLVAEEMPCTCSHRTGLNFRCFRHDLEQALTGDC